MKTMPEKNNKPINNGIINHYASSDIGPPHNPYWVARRALAEKIKHLQLQLQTSELSIDDMNNISTVLDAQSKTLNNKPRLYGRTEWTATGNYGDWGVFQCESTAVIGPSNPISPGLSIWFEQDGNETKAFASVTFNWLYEGADNICHGGWVAAVFDEFLGTAQILSGKTGMTGALTTRYHKPTPLNQALIMTARVDKVEDKKVYMTGEMHAGDKLTASCEGLFVIPGKDPVSHAFGNNEETGLKSGFN